MKISDALSRRRVFILAIIWGVVAIFISGLLSAPAAEALAKLKSDVVDDKVVHYHVSAVITTATTLLAFVLLSLFPLGFVKKRGLSAALKILLLFDLVAVACGGGFTFSIGWIKEILDAMGGKFADMKDINADFIGVMTQAVWSLIFLLPVHGLFNLLAGNVRKGVIKAFTPEKIRKHVDRTYQIEDTLSKNADELSKRQKNLSSLEKEIVKLNKKFNSMSEADKNSAKGREIKDKVAGKENQLVSLYDKIAELERENQCLKDELIKVNDVLREDPENVSMMSEVEEVLASCSFQAGVLSELKERSASRIMLSGNIKEEEKQKLAAPVQAFTVQKQAEAPAPAATPAPEAEANDEALEEAFSRIEELQNELSEKSERVKKLADDNRILKAKAASPAKETEELQHKLDALKRKVFIVEDDKGVRNMMTAAIEEIGYFEVSAYENAVDAINHLKTSHEIPDLVILDIMMPMLSGTEFCAAMQKHKQLKRIPVIFCSACLPDSVPELKGLEYEAYLGKPVKLDQLKTEILKALRMN
ncbi:MAG: response regulator [Planctomycetota bacterium]|jgi:CheY-like chemotaxis protein